MLYLSRNSATILSVWTLVKFQSLQSSEILLSACYANKKGQSAKRLEMIIRTEVLTRLRLMPVLDD